MIKLLQEPTHNIEQLARLLMELDKIHHEFAPERFPLFFLEQRMEQILLLFRDGFLFYAEHGSETIGFASVLKRKEALIIEHLYVRPEFRQQKIGTRLVQFIFDYFPEREIFASAYAFNGDAIQFYAKLFEPSSLVFKRRKIK
jgi:GNAT superfamily N-acetyltransferase